MNSSSDAAYKIDLNVITLEARIALGHLDDTFIGTPHYMGIAYFWGCNGCKFYLREASIAQRRKIHKKWLSEGLELGEESEKHYQIIFDVMKIPYSKSELSKIVNWGQP